MHRKVWWLLVLVLLAACAPPPPELQGRPRMGPVFGTPEGGVIGSQGLLPEGTERPSLRGEGVVESRSCQQLATDLGVAYFRCFERAEDALGQAGGSCVQTQDCECCYLCGYPAQGAPLASAPTATPTPLPAFPTTPEPAVFPTATPPFELGEPVVVAPPDLEGVSDLGLWPEEERGPIQLTLRQALWWTVPAVIVLIFAVVFIESDLLRWPLLRPLSLFYAGFLGAYLVHIWAPAGLLPTPSGVAVPAGILAVVVIFLIGTLLATRTSSLLKQDVLGYLLLLTSGALLHWVLGLGAVLPVVVIA